MRSSVGLGLYLYDSYDGYFFECVYPFHDYGRTRCRYPFT